MGCKIKSSFLGGVFDPVYFFPGSNRGEVSLEASKLAVLMDSISTLIYTSELILCSIICVHSATRHNIRLFLSWTSYLR